MISVEFWNHSKRRNSTKLPTGNPALTLSGEIKGDFSPLHMTIVFRLSDETAAPSYNYARITAFSRFYYVEWAFVDGQWAGTFTVDPLTSYRAAIMESTQYVARSASAVNKTIVDSSYLTTTQKAVYNATVTQQQLWGSDYGSGTYVIGVVGYSGGNIGAVTYYAMNYNAYHAFMGAMLSSPNWLNISSSEISEDLQKALINPAQYIVSCIWLPVDAHAFIVGDPAGTINGVTLPQTDFTLTIKLGWWSLSLPSGNVVRMLHNPNLPCDMFSMSTTINLAKHTQATRGKWLNLSPYTKITLSAPPFGVFDLDTAELVDADTLTVKCFVHAYTGNAKLYVFAGTEGQNAPMLEVESNVGVQLPVGQIAMNLDNLDQAIMTAGVVGAAELVQSVQAGPVVKSATESSTGGTTISGNRGGSHYSGKF